jgi:Flp pilus assembly protein TadG
MIRRLKVIMARLRADARGVAAVEFALMVPILLTVYLAGFELSQAMATYRKVSDTTVELANVTTQYTSMAALDVTSVFNASAQIMSPYATSNLTIVLTEVTTDMNSNATVNWSCAYNGATALTVGAPVTLPAGLAQPGIINNYMLVQTTYKYNPVVGGGFIAPIPMTDQIFMQPRSSADIQLKNQTCP